MPASSQSFVQTRPWEPGPQLLQLTYNAACYKIHILHGSSNEIRRRAPRRSRGHVHDVYHIVLYTRGEGHFQLNGRLHPFAKGTLVLSGPGDVHDFGAVDCEASYAEVSFEYREVETGNLLPLPFPVLVEQITGCAVESFSSPRQLFPAAARSINDALIELVGCLGRASGFGPFHTCVCLARVLDLCLAHCLTPAVSAPRQHRDPIHAVAEYIRSNYNQALNVDELAARTGVSRGHFLRRFKEMLGTSPIAYQLHLRLEAAKVLLKTTDLRCHEIADRIGYADVYHFSRSFKKATGLSPTTFRQTTAYESGNCRTLSRASRVGKTSSRQDGSTPARS